jgi:hypothetical protein
MVINIIFDFLLINLFVWFFDNESIVYFFLTTWLIFGLNKGELWFGQFQTHTHFYY